MYDVIIIGSGIGGISCAARLAKNGLKVLVLEKSDHIGGTSFVFKRGLYSFPMGPLSFSYYRYIEDFLEEIGIDKKIEYKRNHFQLVSPSFNIIYSQPFDIFEEKLRGLFPKERNIDRFFTKLEESDWAALMDYDRDTGNLIKYDPETGKLDDRSRAILRDPEAIQRLIDNKMILPGGWLTREAKQACEKRREGFQEAVEEKKPAENKQSRPNEPQKDVLSPRAQEILDQTKPLKESPKIIPSPPAPAENRVITEVGPEPENKSVKRRRNISEINAVDNNLVSLLDPLSYEAEQFKMLRTNLLFPVSGKAPRSILITSTVPGEGKSFVASNLAIAIAQDIDRYVLVVDCDLRRPKVHTQFGFGDVPGLSDYLTNGIALSDLLINTRVNKLTILPAGKPPPNPAELLSSEKMSALIEEITQRYRDRMIIIDSPPPKLTAESSFLARQVDGIILVVSYGKTRKDDVKELVGKLGKDKILGSVINRFDMRSLGYYGYRKYRKYGHYYGVKS